MDSNNFTGNPDNMNSQKPTSNNITVISMALFILLSLGVVIFLYYQNQQLKGMLANCQTPAISPIPEATTIEEVASPSATPKSSKIPKPLTVSSAVPISVSTPSGSPVRQ
jgi:hypothetical protein